MDKTEKFIREELSSGDENLQFDIDTVIAGTYSSIKKRAIRRKAFYSSPVAILLVLIGIMVIPGNDEDLTLPGSELIVAGWEYSWTETQDLDLVNTQDTVFYDQSVDYLIDDNYFTYVEEADALLDENDLEALMGYLKEA
ncbi:MAG: hypothetical protein ISR87_06085 [Candidatus Marinimicrobia bacterium]|nr:hypothetical protein [FCB group bacterium]MBL7025009.1 hypothetical protein [Candidatus Neomarinimicrobiota bacterium]